MEQSGQSGGSFLPGKAMGLAVKLASDFVTKHTKADCCIAGRWSLWRG